MNHKNKYETITTLKRTTPGAYVLNYRTNSHLIQGFNTYVSVRAIKVFNNNTIKVCFTDGSSTTATKERFDEQTYTDWYESGVMTCLAKRWIGFNRTYNQSAFMKLVDAALKDDAKMQRNEAELKIAEEQSKIKYAKYVAKKKARKERKYGKS